MFKNKKGQDTLETFGSLGIGIATLAILLIVTFLIIGQGETTAEDNTALTTVTNQSVLGWDDNVTRTTLGVASITVDSLTCTSVWNGSNGNVVGAANYSCTDAGIIFVGINTTLAWNDTAIVSYTYKNRSNAYNATITLANAVDSVPPWTPLIVIVVIGGTLLSLVAMIRKTQK